MLLTSLNCNVFYTLALQIVDANLSGHFRHQHHAAMPTLHGEAVATYLNVMYTNGSPSNVKNKRICKEGPVFLAQEVEF